MLILTCDGILFDLDGVLIDSTQLVVRHWTGWARKHGLDVADILSISHGMPAAETMRRVAPHLDIAAEAALFAAAEASDPEGVVAFDGARELLLSLPADAWAVVTSATYAVAMLRFEQTGIPVPRKLVTSDQVRRGKPDPEPYLTGARKLGLAADRCIVFEDAPAGIAAARGADMRVIGMATTHARDVLQANGVFAVINRWRQMRCTAGSPAGRLLLSLEADEAH